MMETIRALRPHQWLKNILVAVPALAAHKFDADTAMSLCLAFVAFSLCASAAYVINDLLDREHDRRHAHKKSRPFATGTLTPTSGGVLATSLLAGGFLVSLPLPGYFLLVLVGYFMVSLVYSLYIKRFPIADVVVLASLYGLRVIAGGVAVAVQLSEWLVAFCFFFFFDLALVKRMAELRATSENLPGRGYRPEDLYAIQALASSTGLSSMVVLALYINSDAVRAFYNRPSALWAVVVILTYWIARVIVIAGRGEMNSDPLIFAVTDRVSILCAAAIALAFGLAL